MYWLFLSTAAGVQVGDDVFAIVDPADTGRILFSEVLRNLQVPGARKYSGLFLPVYFGIETEGAFVEIRAVSRRGMATPYQYREAEDQKKSHGSKIRLRSVPRVNQ